MKEDKVICLLTALQIAERALDPFIGMEPVGRDDEAVIAACHPVVDADAVAHEARCDIARITRPLGNRDILLIQFDCRPLAEYARMLGIHPRLNRCERGIGVLEHGKMLIKDCSACEKVRRFGHVFGKRCAQHLPWQRIHEDIQHEFSSCRAVCKTDWRADDKVLCRGELRIFVEPKIIWRCRIQPDTVVYRICCCREHLSVCRAEDGNNRLRSCLDGDRRFLWRT